MALSSDDDVRVLIGMLDSGEISGEAANKAWADIEAYDASKPKMAMDEMQQEVAGMKEGNRLIGGAVFDTAHTTATGALATVPSGWAGILGGIAGMWPGGEAPYQKAAKWQEKVQGWIATDPHTEGGKKALGAVAEKVAPVLDKWVDITDTGSPAASAALQAVPTALATLAQPEVRGLLTGVKSVPRLTRKGLDAEIKSAYGVDVNDPQTVPGATLSRAGRMAADKKAAGVDELLAQVKYAATASRKAKNDAWTTADSLTGEVSVDTNKLKESLLKLNSEFRADTPAIRKTIADVEKIFTGGRKVPVSRESGVKEVPETISSGYLSQLTESKTKLAKLIELRAKVNNRIGSKQNGKWSSEQQSLIDFNSKLRGTIGDLLDAEAAKAGPDAATSMAAEAKAAIRKADSLTSEHDRKFLADRTIRNLVIKDGTAEEVYANILGKSAVGAKSSARSTIVRLKEILGDDSPVIDNVRSAALRDTLEPLLLDHPDYAAAYKRIDKMVVTHGELLKELGVDVDELRKVSRMASTSAVVKGVHHEQIDSVFLKKMMISVIMNNHLARAAARTKLVQKFALKNVEADAISPENLRMMLVGAKEPIKFPDTPKARMWAAKLAADYSVPDDEEND